MKRSVFASGLISVCVAVSGAGFGLAAHSNATVYQDQGFGVLAGPAIANAAPYKNCKEARANGDSNIPSSSDKYGTWLDRDGDGIGCESSN